MVVSPIFHNMDTTVVSITTSNKFSTPAVSPDFCTLLRSLKGLPLSSGISCSPLKSPVVSAYFSCSSYSLLLLCSVSCGFQTDR